MFYQPSTLEEALEIKKTLRDKGTFIAGGTDIIVSIRKEKRSVENFIDLSRIKALRGLDHQENWISIGAMTNHAELEQLEITALAEAAKTVGGPQIRNLGTVGGQLGSGSPAGDVSTALIGLKAELELVSLRGTRRMPVADFFIGLNQTALKNDELISRIFVPTNRTSAFHKIGKRNAVAISIVMAAVSIGSKGDIAIGVGCVAPIPFRCSKTEQALEKKLFNKELIQLAAKLVTEEVSPISDHRGSADYRRAMSGILVKRLLTEIQEKHLTQEKL